MTAESSKDKRIESCTVCASIAEHSALPRPQVKAELLAGSIALTSRRRGQKHPKRREKQANPDDVEAMEFPLHLKLHAIVDHKPECGTGEALARNHISTGKQSMKKRECKALNHLKGRWRRAGHEGSPHSRDYAVVCEEPRSSCTGELSSRAVERVVRNFRYHISIEDMIDRSIEKVEQLFACLKLWILIGKGEMFLRTPSRFDWACLLEVVLALRSLLAR